MDQTVGPPLAVERLKIRADFLRAARGIRRVEGAITLETCATPTPKPDQVRVGFTASKKIGNAVTRIESVRSKLQFSRLKTDFFADKRDVYDASFACCSRAMTLLQRLNTWSAAVPAPFRIISFRTKTPMSQSH